MDGILGAKVWCIPDGYLPTSSSGKLVSHECISVLNPGKVDAEIEITLYFEDRDKMEGFKVNCKAERTNHIRMDKIIDLEGNKVPVYVPYSMMVESNTEIIVQYSKLDCTQAEMALMTTMAHPLK